MNNLPPAVYFLKVYHVNNSQTGKYRIYYDLPTKNIQIGTGGIAQYIGKDMSYEATTKRLSFELRNIGGLESLNQNNYVSLSYTTSKDNNILYLGGSASGVSIIDTENITLKEKNIYLSKLLEHRGK